MANYTIVSDNFPSPTNEVNIDLPQYILDPLDGKVLSGMVDIELTYTNMNGEVVTVPFTASETDPMDYGRQIYADIMESRVSNLGAIKTPVWDGPPPPPEPTPEQQEIADLKERLAALERLLK